MSTLLLIGIAPSADTGNRFSTASARLQLLIRSALPSHGIFQSHAQATAHGRSLRRQLPSLERQAGNESERALIDELAGFAEFAIASGGFTVHPS